MCFRPATTSKNIICPNCQKKLSIQPGMNTKKCPFCEGDLQLNKQGNQDNPTSKDL